MKDFAVIGIVALGIACGKPSEPSPQPKTHPISAVATTKSDVVRDLNEKVKVREVVLDRGGQPMTLWIYRPAESGTAAKRPVILIAAAGSPMFWGVALTEGDRDEHLPWVQRGYIVVAYSVDGGVPHDDNANEQRAGVRSFLRAHAGLDNGKAALDFALANETSIDPTRIFSVGHSSAATLSLRVGAEDGRVKAIVAFAPVADVDERVASALSFIDSVDPDGRAILHASSPMTFVAALRKKPVFLFHAEDDGNVPVAGVRALLDAMKPVEPRTKLTIVPSGGHYESMIGEGIPAAAAWLETTGL